LGKRIFWCPQAKLMGRPYILIPQNILLLLQYRAKITCCLSHNVASKLVHKSFEFLLFKRRCGAYPFRPYFSLSQKVTGTTI